MGFFIVKPKREVRFGQISRCVIHILKSLPSLYTPFVFEK